MAPVPITLDNFAQYEILNTSHSEYQDKNVDTVTKCRGGIAEGRAEYGEVCPRGKMAR